MRSFGNVPNDDEEPRKPWTKTTAVFINVSIVFTCLLNMLINQ